MVLRVDLCGFFDAESSEKDCTTGDWSRNETEGFYTCIINRAPIVMDYYSTQKGQPVDYVIIQRVYQKINGMEISMAKESSLVCSGFCQVI